MTQVGGSTAPASRSHLGTVLLAAVGAAVLALLVALGADLGSRHAQIVGTFATQTALWLTMTWHIVALSRTQRLLPRVRRYWRILILTGAGTTGAYAVAVLTALREPTDQAAFLSATSGIFAAASGVALALAGLTYRTDRDSRRGQARTWLDALVTMIAALGALWFFEAVPLHESGASAATVATNVTTNALSLVAILSLLRPMASDVRPLSFRGGMLAFAAIATGTSIEILAPHAIGTPSLRLVLALRLIPPILAATGVWQQRFAKPSISVAGRRAALVSRVPYFAVALTYVLLGTALVISGASGQVWGLFAAAAAVTALVAFRQFLASRDNAALVIELRAAVTAAADATEQLHQHAYFDELTKLPNRAHFSERLEELLAPSSPSRHDTAVMLLDLDDFKLVNDRAGHAAGDALLRLVAARLTAAVGPDGLVIRLGGDEFAVLVGGATERTVATLAARVAAAFDTPFHLTDGDAAVGVSIGTAVSDGADESAPAAQTLLRNADIAMYDAKAAGKNRVEAFRPGMLAEVRARHDTREALAAALDSDEIVVHYQPIVASGSHRAIAVEALVRWRRPGFGIVTPTDFLPLAEQLGLIAAIDHFVLRRACAQTREWDLANSEPLGVHVNVSAITLAEPAFVEAVHDALRDTGLRPSRLTMELTESALMSNPDTIMGSMTRLREMGVRVAIDDFGTGYSSLAYLRDLPLDVVKMDCSFVERITRSPSDREVVRMIVELATTLGLHTVAEGIETVEQAAYLSSIGCRGMQGHLFAAAVAADELPAAIRRASSRTLSYDGAVPQPASVSRQPL